MSNTECGHVVGRRVQMKEGREGGRGAKGRGSVVFEGLGSLGTQLADWKVCERPMRSNRLRSTPSTGWVVPAKTGMIPELIVPFHEMDWMDRSSFFINQPKLRQFGRADENWIN